MRRVTLDEPAAQTDEIFTFVESGGEVIVTRDGRDAVRIVVANDADAGSVER